MKKPAAKTLILGLALSLTVISSLKASPWSGQSFSALQVEFDESMPQKLDKSRVFVSREGFRIETPVNAKSSEAKLVSLYRFKEDKNLLINPKRKTYAVIEEMPNLQIEDDLGSVLSRQPCEGFSKAKNTGIEKLQNRNLEKWACLHPTENFAVFQYYDPKIKLVLRENFDGRIIELRNIKQQKQKKSLFEIPKGYKKVSMIQMIKDQVNLQGAFRN